MNNKKLLKPSITEDQFFGISNIKNKKIIQLTSIVKEVEDKINELGLAVNFVKKKLK